MNYDGKRKTNYAETKNKIKVIGITGEVGAGKSVVMEYLYHNYPCEILMADTIGNEVKEPGSRCYDDVVGLLGKEILFPDGTMNREIIAEKIFANPELVEEMNRIIHPAVHDEIFERIAKFQEDGRVAFVFLEAALLIEAGYVDEIDEMWYICSDAVCRRTRLKESRGYSDERIDGIAKNQSDTATFMQYADRVIVNNTTKEDLYRKIDAIMGEYQWQK